MEASIRVRENTSGFIPADITLPSSSSKPIIVQIDPFFGADKYVGSTEASLIRKSTPITRQETKSVTGASSEGILGPYPRERCHHSSPTCSTSAINDITCHHLSISPYPTYDTLENPSPKPTDKSPAPHPPDSPFTNPTIDPLIAQKKTLLILAQKPHPHSITHPTAQAQILSYQIHRR